MWGRPGTGDQQARRGPRGRTVRRRHRGSRPGFSCVPAPGQGRPVQHQGCTRVCRVSSSLARQGSVWSRGGTEGGGPTPRAPPLPLPGAPTGGGPPAGTVFLPPTKPPRGSPTSLPPRGCGPLLSSADGNQPTPTEGSPRGGRVRWEAQQQQPPGRGMEPGCDGYRSGCKATKAARNRPAAAARPPGGGVCARREEEPEAPRRGWGPSLFPASPPGPRRVCLPGFLDAGTTTTHLLRRVCRLPSRALSPSCPWLPPGRPPPTATPPPAAAGGSVRCTEPHGPAPAPDPGLRPLPPQGGRVCGAGGWAGPSATDRVRGGQKGEREERRPRGSAEQGGGRASSLPPAPCVAGKRGTAMPPPRCGRR